MVEEKYYFQKKVGNWLEISNFDVPIQDPGTEKLLASVCRQI
jgi:hypothetical protein